MTKRVIVAIIAGLILTGCVVIVGSDVSGHTKGTTESGLDTGDITRSGSRLR